MNYKQSTNTPSSRNLNLSADRVHMPRGTYISIELFSGFVLSLLQMDPAQRELLLMRYLGFTYREIGEQLGISTQLAEMRHKRALRDWPVLKTFFPRKMARKARRDKSQ